MLPPEKAPCAALSLTLIDSVYRHDKRIYRQVHLQECKYIAKVNTIVNIFI